MRHPPRRSEPLPISKTTVAGRSVPIGITMKDADAAGAADSQRAAVVVKRAIVGGFIEDVLDAPVRFRNHIVVCGLGDVPPSFLLAIMDEFRASTLPVHPTIVIMQSTLLPPRILQLFKKAKDVWFIQVRLHTVTPLVCRAVVISVVCVCVCVRVCSSVLS
jgi:hypothetical protein